MRTKKLLERSREAERRLIDISIKKQFYFKRLVLEAARLFEEKIHNDRASLGLA